MKEHKTAGGLLVAIEIVLLVVVLVMVIVQPFGNNSSGDGDRDWSAESVSTDRTEQMFADESEDTQLLFSDTEDTQQSAEQTAGESSVERLTFSDEVEAKLEDMTTEEQIAQMFLITPEALTGVDQATVAGDGTKAAIEQYPVGGLVYSASNFQGKDQTTALLANTQEYIQDRIGISLFLAIEEEGGEDASPLATTLSYTVTGQPSSWETADAAEQNAADILSGLTEIGFNLNIALTTDCNSGAGSTYDAMTLASDTATVTELLTAELTSYESAGVWSAMKYFPEKTSASEDEESGYLVSSRTLDEVTEHELAVMSAGAEAGADFAVVSSVVDTQLTGGTEVPCCLSAEAVSVLRGSLGDGVLILTDSLSDAAITEHYSAAEAAVAAVNAGVDLLYLPADFEEAYQAVVDGVANGTIDEDLIYNAAGRVLTCKLAAE